MNSCIYMIYNLKNGKCYIGSTKNFISRKKKHLYLLRHNKHHSIYLQNACNKYSESDFIFIILELTKDLFNNENKWIIRLSPEYNLGSIGGGDNISNHPNLDEIKKKHSVNGKNRYKNLTSEEKIKLSQKFIGDKNPNWKGGISKPKCLCGKIIQPKSTICHTCRMKNISGKNNSFYGKKHSEETKKKLSEYKKNNSKNAKSIEIDGKVYNSISEASATLNINIGTIRYRLKTNKLGYKII